METSKPPTAYNTKTPSTTNTQHIFLCLTLPPWNQRNCFLQKEMLWYLPNGPATLQTPDLDTAWLFYHPRSIIKCNKIIKIMGINTKFPQSTHHSISIPIYFPCYVNNIITNYQNILTHLQHHSTLTTNTIGFDPEVPSTHDQKRKPPRISLSVWNLRTNQHID